MKRVILGNFYKSHEYFEWVDHYMNFLPLRTKVYSIFAFFVREKEKVF